MLSFTKTKNRFTMKQELVEDWTKARRNVITGYKEHTFRNDHFIMNEQKKELNRIKKNARAYGNN